jgi:signal transduction histidine kinase
MKKQHISYRLLKNYVVIFILTTMVTVLVFAVLGWLNQMGTKDSLYTKLSATALMQDDYLSIDTRALEEHGGGMQIVNASYEVVRSAGKNPLGSDALTAQKFTDFLINSAAGKDYTTVAHNPAGDFWLVVSLPMQVKITGSISINSDSPVKDKSLQFLAFLGGGYLFILTVSTILYSRITASGFINPLKRLGSAVKQIRSGDYSTRVPVGGLQEFRELESAFNHMAEEIERQAALKELSEANRKRLILDISHDLRNPLTSIKGYSERMLKELQAEKTEYESYLRMIHGNSLRAHELIQDLFELSKLESPEFRLDWCKEDFGEYLREELILMLPELETAGLVMEFMIPDEDIVLRFDKLRMKRVLSNLLYNAMAYGDKDNKLTIRLGRKQGGGAELVLANRGPVVQQKAEQLLKPFVQEEGESSSLNAGGAGLGLAIVKKIISAHEGTVELQTQDGLFEVTLWLPDSSDI